MKKKTNVFPKNVKVFFSLKVGPQTKGVSSVDFSIALIKQQEAAYLIAAPSSKATEYLCFLGVLDKKNSLIVSPFCPLTFVRFNFSFSGKKRGGLESF